ncbi:MAG: hypothetical protein ACRD1V_01735 [Vicinamibacterales bacterium]
MSTEERAAAQRRLHELIDLIGRMPQRDEYLPRLVHESEALDRAISAFHLEGIRFRIYNLDRMIEHSPVALPAEARSIVDDVRKHLEAAGFHTRSHA